MLLYMERTSLGDSNQSLPVMGPDRSIAVHRIPAWLQCAAAATRIPNPGENGGAAPRQSHIIVHASRRSAAVPA